MQRNNAHTMSPQSPRIWYPEGNTMLALHITPSEHAVLKYLATGAATIEIAHRLGMNEPEIESCLQLLFARMGVRTRGEAVAAAMRRGLLAA
jgi:DNA-binding CsgD family transcriptional regulator